MTGHTDSVETAKMSSSLPYSATGSVDGNLIIWDNMTLSIRSTSPHPEVGFICLRVEGLLSASSVSCLGCSCRSTELLAIYRLL
jgi:WD40 repeat protein